MKITWLGQAGLLFERGGVSIMIDPYLSNYVEKVQPANYRRSPVNEKFFDIDPDIMIFTHDHIDHYDPETAPVFFKKSKKTMSVLGPTSVRAKAMGDLCGQNYILFDKYTSVTLEGFIFTAVRAAHSDPYAIGVVIEDTVENKVYYVTGDTFCNREIFADLPEDIEAMFLWPARHGAQYRRPLFAHQRRWQQYEYDGCRAICQENARNDGRSAPFRNVRLA